MPVQNYYKITDSLNGVQQRLFPENFSPLEYRNDAEVSSEFSKPYLISFENMGTIKKALLLCLMFGSLFLIGLKAQTTKTVGATGGNDYTTLKAAFDAVNAGSITGNIVLNITSNTTEIATATLNASGSGSANYTSIAIQPSGGNKVNVIGNLASGLISLNGANNITIDGLNSGGDSLVLMNTHTSGFTLQLINSASNNTITNLSLLGAVTSTTTGVLSFATASASLAYGNNSNIISYCNISKETGGNKPVNAVYSLGTVGKSNSNNTIQSCNIFDFQSSSVTHTGIKLSANNSAWTISDNKLYRTNVLNIISASVLTYGIYVNDGDAYHISNNSIGSASNDGSGIFSYDVSAINHTFYGIYLRSTGTLNSNISGNTIANIEIRTGANSFIFYGLYFDGTASPIDLTVESNTIGSLTNANSLVLKTNNRLDLYPIRFNGASNNYQVTLSSNAIGSINSSTNNLLTFYTSMIFISGSTSSLFEITNNTIGAAGNGIISLGTTTATGDYKVYGVYLGSSGGVDLTNNTICHLYENSIGTTNPWIFAVYVSFAGGTVSTPKEISNNTIHDIISYSGYSSFGARVAVGIYIETGNNTYTLMVSDNTIYDIKYLGAAAVSNNVSAIGIPSTSQKMKIFNNIIYDIENNSTYAWTSNTYDRGGISGIEMNNSTNSTNLVEIYNNRIHLKATNGGVPICVPIKGIEVHSLSAVYFNTVIISGTSCGIGGATLPTTCISGGQYLEIPVYNNIFCNTRTGNGKHYAIANDGYTTYSTINYTFFTNYNLYYTSNAATMGKWGGSDRTFAQWKTSVYNSGSGPNVDLNSQYTNPLFADITDLNKWYAAGTSSPIVNAGTPMGGINNDALGYSRNITTPYLGAMEKTINIWVGSVSDDWGTPANWYSGILPLADEDIFFAASPMNHCVLDGNKSIGDLDNQQNNFDLVLNGYSLTVKGDLLLYGVAEIDAQYTNSEIKFSGTAPQDIPIASFINSEIYSLTVNNPFGITMHQNLQIMDALTMNSGDINNTGNILTLGSSSINTGTLNYTSGHIQGSFMRWFNANVNSGNSGLFPLGVGTNDRFVTVEYGTAPISGGTLTATVNTGDMGTAGLPITNIAAVGSCSGFDVTATSDNGYWVIDAGNGLSGGSYDITLVGQGINGISSLCELTAIKRVSMSNWFESGTHQVVSGSTSRPVLKRSNASGWSNWGFGGGGLNPLPIKIISLKAVCAKNKDIITWNTGNEVNIALYELERSTDGKHWESSGVVNATNDGNAYHQYSITFSNIESITFFYRLKTVDINHKANYSFSVITECMDANTSKIELYPNPATSNIFISSENILGHVEIFNALGELVFEIDTDSNALEFQLKDFNSGVYLIKTNFSQMRFVKN